MYLMSVARYECDIYGFSEAWDAHDERNRDLWECESCMKHFCTKCFIDKFGRLAFEKMLTDSERVSCPECYVSTIEEGDEHINETQKISR